LRLLLPRQLRRRQRLHLRRNSSIKSSAATSDIHQAHLSLIVFFERHFMRHLLLVSLCAAVLGACASAPASGPSAVAELQSTKGNVTAGNVTFTQRGSKVLVSGTVTGLKPNQEHGFHIHEKGDCSSGDGMSTGGHFNPTGKPHGHHGSGERHAGDLPALMADAAGKATFSVEMDVITVADGPASVVGRGMIVHVQPDDYKTQPTGNAGARSACAVIRRV
jgi:Cu-Zn family superoxide dismutase